jgi:RHH-type rel operon transcriptional repressor/antitoxin RelB
LIYFYAELSTSSSSISRINSFVTASIEVKNFICYTCISNKKSLMLAIRLPEDIELRLGALASKTGRTKTFYAREAILEHINDLEDLYLAEKRLDKIKSGKTKTIKLSQLERELGLAD